jgi:hypothetical protein
MARINSREEFKNYCARALGAPVLRINVDAEQVEDRVDDALDLFWEYHSDGSELVYLNIQVTPQHIADRFFQLPAETQSVLRVMHGGSGMGSNGIANTNLQYQAYITDMMNPRKIVSAGLSQYYVTQSYLSLMNDTFSSESRINFNQHYDQLQILDSWDLITPGSWIAVEAYVKVTPEKSGDVWNNRWLKKYAIALIKKQWGTNLIKFTNASLPGGVQMNGEAILAEAQTEIETLKAELHDFYECPPSFFVG